MATTKQKIALIGFLLIMSLTLLYNSTTTISLPNYGDVNVTTKVNITNAFPEILALTPDLNILLNAGSTKQVNCNVTVRDWNGWNDIYFVNATFYDNTSSSPTAADDNNTHYTNTNCTLISNDAEYTANYTCNFSVYYFANASNWMCNTTVMDRSNFTDKEKNLTAIQAYYALNVTSPIDFGDMMVGDYKTNISANITNFGNKPINISVNGFGITPNDGLAMNCNIRNITISNLHYSTTETDWASGTALTSAQVNISDLIVPKRITGMMWNQTYWHLYIPPSENPFGLCNGTVVFTAYAG